MDKAYPGDDVVDAMGPDFYDGEQVLYNQNQPLPPQWAGVWNNFVLANDPTNNLDGLPWWKDFAAQHNKPLALPQWGLEVGGDNTYFIQAVHDWIYKHNVLFSIYYDTTGLTSAKLSPPTSYPNASALYLKLFGGSGSPVTPPPPSPTGSSPQSSNSANSGPQSSATSSINSSKSSTGATGSTAQASKKLSLPANIDINTVKSVEYELDGKLIATLTQKPFTYNIDESKLASGCHTILTIAHLTDGSIKKSTQSFCLYHTAGHKTNKWWWLLTVPFVGGGAAGIWLYLRKMKQHKQIIKDDNTNVIVPGQVSQPIIDSVDLNKDKVDLT
jgi:hypothetical protein